MAAFPTDLDQWWVPVVTANEETAPFAAPISALPLAITGLFVTAPPTVACQRTECEAALTLNAVTAPLPSPTTSVEVPGSSAGDPSIAPGTVAVQSTLPVCSAI